MSSITKHFDDSLTLQFNPTNNRKRYVHVETGDVYKAVSTVNDKVLAKDLSYWAARCGSEYVLATIKPGEALDEVQIAALAAGSLSAHKRISNASADAGTFVHDWLHAMLRGEVRKLPENNKMAIAATAAFQWFNNHTWQLVLAEHPLCSPKLKMAGTPDGVGYLDGKLTILDWKTGKDIYYAALIQCAFYAIMFEEEYGLKIEQIVLVNASLENPFKTYTTANVRHLMQMARAVHRLYKSMGVYDKQLSKGDR
jgi:hypothetical protein